MPIPPLFVLQQHNTPANKRSPTTQQTNVVCRNVPGYTHGRKATIEDGIAYLRKHDPPEATICHQAGGGCCTRVSCALKSGIYACNDDPDHDRVVGLSAVADLAQDILDTEDCVWHPSTSRAVLGQAFDDGWWNVIVGIKDGDDC